MLIEGASLASDGLPENASSASDGSETVAEQTKQEKGSSPLFAMMERNGASSGLKIKMNRKNYYSGKKKCHAVKNVLLVDKQLKIQYLSETHPGKVHDKRVADATPDPLPQGSVLLQDLVVSVLHSKEWRSKCRPKTHRAGIN